MPPKSAQIIKLFEPRASMEVLAPGDAHETLTEPELVQLAQEGSRRAVEVLIGRYHQKAYDLAFQMSDGDTDRARDITQEAFLKVFRNVKKFKGRSTFFTWLYRIIVNTCLDARRRRRSRSRLFALIRPADENGSRRSDPVEGAPDASGSSDPLAALANKELQHTVRQKMLELPEKQRLAFELKIHHGLKISEIAMVMKAAEGTVKTHLYRAMQSMRQALADWI